MKYFFGTALLMFTLLLGACKLDNEVIVPLVDGENLLYTDTGRLLVSDKQNVFEIKKDTTGYTKTPLSPDGNCIFDGIAQYNKWIFSVCSKGLSSWKLYAAGVKDNGEISFSEIGVLPKFILANGIAFTAQGDLLIADTNPLNNKNYGLAKVKINHAAMPDYNDPHPVFDASKIIVSIDKKWLDLNPNGVRVKGNTLFVTEINRVRKYHLDDQGEVIDSQILLEQKGYLDDLYPICDGAIVANFAAGTIFYVDKNGIVDPHYKTPNNALGGPTAMLIAHTDLFPQGGLLVTEGGLPFEYSGKVGDRLIRLDMGIDFASLEAACDSAQ